MLIDHLILGVRDLESGKAELEGRLGVALEPGGRHVGRGTANALLRLGDSCYLEVLGPDPDAPDGAAPAAWLTAPWLGAGRLIGWAVRSADIEFDVNRLRSAGWDPGLVSSMRRQAPGGELQWRLTESGLERGVSVYPFLIDWGTSPHPAASLMPGVKLRSLVLGHPDPAAVAAVVALLEVDVEVERAASPSLRALLETPTGPMELEALAGDPGLRSGVAKPGPRHE